MSGEKHMNYLVENATIKKATERAVLVEADNWDAAVWIPRSQIEGGEELDVDEEHEELRVSDWFAQQKDWV